MAIKILRGKLADKPTLLAGQKFLVTDKRQLRIGLDGDEIIFQGSNLINHANYPGMYGYSVGICPENLLPVHLIAMEGTTVIGHANYGNYYNVRDGSIEIYKPMSWVRITNDSAAPYYGTKVETVPIQHYEFEGSAVADGFFLPRCYINTGKVVLGYFVDKYRWSLTGVVWDGETQTAGVASSIKNANPISSSSDSKRSSTNLYAGSFSNCFYDDVAADDNYGGAWKAAKSRGAEYANLSKFIQTMLALESLAHGQAIYNLWYSGQITENEALNRCAWFDKNLVTNFPKGQNYYGTDYNDQTIAFSVCDDSYWASRNEARKTGSGSTFAKTTHNGQACGVSDIGGQLEIVQGLTNIGGTADGYRILKESVDLKTVTGGSGGASDHFANATIFDTVTLPTALTGDSGWAYIGNSNNQTLSGEPNRNQNAYLLTALGIGKDNNAYGSSINMFGNDGHYKTNANELCPIVFGSWGSAATAGVWCGHLSSIRAYSGTHVSARACLYV
jgi:hypothetical protein